MYNKTLLSLVNEEHMEQNKQFSAITRTARMPKGSYEKLYTTKGSFEGSGNIRPITLLDPPK